jgi:hypothetical protein
LNNEGIFSCHPAPAPALLTGPGKREAVKAKIYLIFLWLTLASGELFLWLDSAKKRVKPSAHTSGNGHPGADAGISVSARITASESIHLRLN